MFGFGYIPSHAHGDGDTCNRSADTYTGVEMWVVTIGKEYTRRRRISLLT